MSSTINLKLVEYVFKIFALFVEFSFPSPPLPSLSSLPLLFLQTSRRSVSSMRSDEVPLVNGSSGVGEEPSVPAPIRSNTVDIQLPASLTTKMKLGDFSFLKVGHFKNSQELLVVDLKYTGSDPSCVLAHRWDHSFG